MTLPRRAPSAQADDGSVLLLILGLVVLLVLVVTVVVDVTALFLARRDLLAAADGAALAGAQAVDEVRLYTEGLGDKPLPLQPARAEQAARDYLRDVGVGGRLDQLQVDVDATTYSVSVRLVGIAPLPFVSRLTPGAAGGVEVFASATAATSLVAG
ncbi:MAG TPA: pilus assembly protein TadG-related protein [Actinomycetes bacterium]|nr:pilus assembly protein TadG-related protein [Actinomycetes bacterium]